MTTTEPAVERFRSDSLRPPNGAPAWDLLVVGGGTAGLIGAQTAAAFGASVLLVEQARTGGDCLWTGCVPSKSLLAAAHAAADARAAAELGVRADPTVDFAAVMRHVRGAIATIAPVDSPEALRAAGVAVAQGTLRFTGPDTAEVVGTDGEPAGIGNEPAAVRFRQALVATGSEAQVPPIAGLADAAPLTSDTVWALDSLPGRLLVLGGGSIGCELGQAFARLGSEVTLVETADRLLPAEDRDASRTVKEALQRDGATVHAGIEVARVRRNGTAWCAELADGREVGFDQVIVATGRRPRTDGLGLETAGVPLSGDGYVAVDERLRATPRFWAAGDVTGFPQFTHTAGVSGSIAATNAIVGLRRSLSTAAVPRVTYTQPEVASVGIVGDAATDQALTLRTVRHTTIDRAITENRTEGFSRLSVDKRSRIVGATIVGPRAGESLAEMVLAVSQGLTTRDLAGSMHAYPTYSDGVWNAGIAHMRGALGKPATRTALGLLVRVRRRWVRPGRRRPGDAR